MSTAKTRRSPDIQFLTKKVNNFNLEGEVDIFFVLIFDKFIFAVKPSGIILLKLSSNPPPVIFAQDLIKLESKSFNTSLT